MVIILPARDLTRHGGLIDDAVAVGLVEVVNVVEDGGGPGVGGVVDAGAVEVRQEGALAAVVVQVLVQQVDGLKT